MDGCEDESSKSWQIFGRHGNEEAENVMVSGGSLSKPSDHYWLKEIQVCLLFS